MSQQGNLATHDNAPIERRVPRRESAAAGIREQHDRSPGPVNGAFERRAANFDVSMPLQSHSPATRLTLDALKRLVGGPITVLSARYQRPAGRRCAECKADPPRDWTCALGTQLQSDSE